MAQRAVAFTDRASDGRVISVRLYTDTAPLFASIAVQFPGRRLDAMNSPILQDRPTVVRSIQHMRPAERHSKPSQ